MKKLIFLLTPLFLIFNAAAQQNRLFYITEDYTNYFLLQLKLDENTYIFSKHSAKRIQIDKGKLHKKGKTIELESETKNYGFNLYLHKKIYLKNYTIYLSKADMLIGRNGIYPTPENELGLDYKFENLDEFAATDRIKVERKSESMNQFRGLEFEERFKEILKLRVPEYLPLVDKYYLGPEDYTHYIDDKRVDWDQDVSGYAVLDMFSTIVHESAHHANGSDSILLYPDSLMELKRTEIIPTRNMAKFFKQKCFTKNIFRFNYVGEVDSNLASNISGIYGLMNEFTAYYHDTRIAYLMYKKYEELGEDYLYYKEMMGADACGTYYAYYEFNLFMGGYLAYLKTNHPTIYKATINNQSLCKAYTFIDKHYKEIVSKVETELSTTEAYQYHYNKYVKFVKQDLQQFLPELEVLKNNAIANN
mgnify:CR=1 FL=1